MKKKYLISTAAACLLLTGCAAGRSGGVTAPKVNYSDLFQPKSSSGEALQEKKVNGKADSPIEEKDILSDDTYAVSEEKESRTFPSSGLTVSKSRTAKAAPGGAEQTPDSGNQGNNTVSDSENSDTDQSTDNSAPNTSADTSVSIIDNRNPKSVIYTDAQAVADLSLGDICYFPYKNGNEDKPDDTSENENEETEDNAEGEDSSKEEIKRPKPKYDYGYRVVFRTETDTYLMGIFPYDYCRWDDVNDMCLKIEGMIEADCQMVGIPSFDDLRYFTDRGIYLPGKYEMWTQTPATTNGSKFFYRNEKGAFNTTKSKTEKCGVCAIIKITAPQNDPELLSSSLADYETAKARLEAEEEQYKLAISEE